MASNQPEFGSGNPQDDLSNLIGILEKRSFRKEEEERVAAKRAMRRTRVVPRRRGSKRERKL